MKVVGDDIVLRTSVTNQTLSREQRQQYQKELRGKVPFQFDDLGLTIGPETQDGVVIGQLVMLTIRPVHACMCAAGNALRARGIYSNPYH